MSGGVDFKLYPKQAAALTTDANFILFGGAAGAGKELILNTPVYTTLGWSTIGNLKIGDKVFDREGNPCNVIAKSEVSYERQAYELTFEDGESVVAGATHDWYSLNALERVSNFRRSAEFKARRRANRPPRGNGTKPWLAELNAKRAAEKAAAGENLLPDFGFIRDTQYMYENQKVIKNGVETTTPNFSISVITSAIAYPEHTLPMVVEPYLYGLWLGDGSSKGTCIANGDRQIVDYILSVRPHATVREDQNVLRSGELGAVYWNLSIAGLKNELLASGASGDKCIPERYMRASVSDRLELLRGIMDTDGYIEKNRAYLTMSRKDLVEQIRELAASLGMRVSRISSKKPFYTKDDGTKVYCKTAYTFHLFTDVCPFHLERKAKEFKARCVIANKTHTYRIIKSIKPVDNHGMQCIQVDSPDNTYLITKSFIPTHNSYLIRAASIIYAIEIPGSTNYVFRKNYADLKANHIDSNGGYLHMLADMMDNKLVTYNKSEYSFSFVNGSRIQLAHLNAETDLLSYQGREMTSIIIDESTQMSAYSIMYLISRLRLGGLQIPEKWKGKFPRCILCTNPGGISHDWHKKTFVDYGTVIHRLPADKSGMLAQFIPSRLEDNIVQMQNDPDYADKLRGLSVGSPELVKAMLEGSWDITGDSAFTSWDSKIHVINPFVIPKTWKIYRGMDWGYSNPYYVGYYAISNGEDYLDDEGEYRSAPKGSIFYIAEIYGADSDDRGIKEEPTEMAARIRTIDESLNAIGYKIHPGPADSSIWNKDRGESIASIFTRCGINWVKSNKTPGSRIIGLQLMNQMLYSATQDTPETPYIKFFKTCPAICRQLPNLQRDKKRPEDVDTSGNDHSWDQARYAVLHARDLVQTKKVIGV
jgi:hypothetical protein